MRDPHEPTDWDLAEGLDPNGPSADDLDRFGDEMTTCASCGRDVYDQSEICPICGGFVHEQTKTPAWAIAIVLLMVGLLVFFFVL